MLYINSNAIYYYFSDPEAERPSLPSLGSLLGAVRGSAVLVRHLLTWWPESLCIRKWQLSMSSPYGSSTVISALPILSHLFLPPGRQVLLSPLYTRGKWCLLSWSWILNPSLAYFHAISMTCTVFYNIMLSLVSSSYFLIPEISHLLLLVTSLTQSVTKGIQVTIVYCVFTVDAPMALGHIIRGSQCVLVGCLWVSFSS